MNTHRMRIGLAAGLCAVILGVSMARAATASIDVSTTIGNGWTVSGGGATNAQPMFLNGTELSLTSDGTAGGTPAAGFNPAAFDGFWTASYSFTLPAGVTDATLSYNGLTADDRAVLFLNGTRIADVGTTGPGAGTMVLTSGGAETPFTFAQNTSGTISSGFVAGGTNTLTAVINNTSGGIAGTLAPLAGTNHTDFAITGSISYTPTSGGGTNTPAAVPLPPAAWTGLVTLLGLAGLGTHRRRSSAKV